MKLSMKSVDALKRNFGDEPVAPAAVAAALKEARKTYNRGGKVYRLCQRPALEGTTVTEESSLPFAPVTFWTFDRSHTLGFAGSWADNIDGGYLLLTATITPKNVVLNVDDFMDLYGGFDGDEGGEHELLADGEFTVKGELVTATGKKLKDLGTLTYKVIPVGGKPVKKAVVKKVTLTPWTNPQYWDFARRSRDANIRGLMAQIDAISNEMNDEQYGSPAYKNLMTEITKVQAVLNAAVDAYRIKHPGT